VWLALYRAIPSSVESKRILTAVLPAVALITTMTLMTGAARAAWHVGRYLTVSGSETAFLQSGYTNWKVANYLHSAGVRGGDSVGRWMDI